MSRSAAKEANEETTVTDTLTWEKIASELARARSGRSAVTPLTERVPGFDVAAAYAVQEVARQQAGPLAGWKLGLTSPAKQRQLGAAEPIRGFLAAADALDLGAPLDVAVRIQPRVEPEIAFTIARDIAGSAVTAAQVLAATATVAPAIEIVDSRYRDYRFTLPDVIADNASAGAFVVGAGRSPEGIDLRLAGVVIEHRGRVAATAAGAASLGHPAAAVAWLVRSLAAIGEGLRVGDVVLSGGLTEALPVTAGDCVVVSVGRRGSVELACR